MVATLPVRQLMMLVVLALVLVAVVVATVTLTGEFGGPESELFARGSIPWAI